MNATEQLRPTVVVLAMCGFLAGGCGGKAVENALADASSAADGRATIDVNVDSGGCMISASNYDQSCKVDTDCTLVSSGDYCSAACGDCGGSTIGAQGLIHFQEDVSKTPLGSGALGNISCGCPARSEPCCRHGTCKVGYAACSSPADTLPACADAGATCIPSGASCDRPGPTGACAYSDETCCIN